MKVTKVLFYVYVSSHIDNLAPAAIKITPNETQVRQTIFGFGGAFTDAAGINLQTLTAATQQNFINTYFGAEGGQTQEEHISHFRN